MFKIASKCAYRVAVCAPAEVAAYSSIATSSSVLKQGTQAALIPICSWFASSSAAVGIPRAQQSFCPAATAGAHRWRTGVCSIASSLSTACHQLLFAADCSLLTTCCDCICAWLFDLLSLLSSKQQWLDSCSVKCTMLLNTYLPFEECVLIL